MLCTVDIWRSNPFLSHCQCSRQPTWKAICLSPCVTGASATQSKRYNNFCLSSTPHWHYHKQSGQPAGPAKKERETKLDSADQELEKVTPNQSLAALSCILCKHLCGIQGSAQSIENKIMVIKRDKATCTSGRLVAAYSKGSKTVLQPQTDMDHQTSSRSPVVKEPRAKWLKGLCARDSEFVIADVLSPRVDPNHSALAPEVSIFPELQFVSS